MAEIWPVKRVTVLIGDSYGYMHIDPSVRLPQGGRTPGIKIVIDATLKADPGPLSLPPKEVMARALDGWRETGLPEFAIAKRARLRIERS